MASRWPACAGAPSFACGMGGGLRGTRAAAFRKSQAIRRRSPRPAPQVTPQPPPTVPIIHSLRRITHSRLSRRMMDQPRPSGHGKSRGYPPNCAVWSYPLWKSASETRPACPPVCRVKCVSFEPRASRAASHCGAGVAPAPADRREPRRDPRVHGMRTSATAHAHGPPALHV